jgi:hypothetical protein
VRGGLLEEAFYPSVPSSANSMVPVAPTETAEARTARIVESAPRAPSNPRINGFGWVSLVPGWFESLEPGPFRSVSVRVVHDGVAITSAGGAKSYESGLYLAELLYGTRVAEGIARGLVIDWDLKGIKFRKVDAKQN